jgi:hypothetical protein
MRFVLFHYVLFADRTTAARAAATGPDAVPPSTHRAPQPVEAPRTAARTVSAEAVAAHAAAAGGGKVAARRD